MRLLFVLIFALPELSAAKQNFIYSPKSQTLRKRTMRAWNSTSYFETESSWDPDGNERTFTEGESFTVLENRLTFSYGVSHQLQFNIGGNYRQVSATVIASNNNSLELSNSGIESYFGGLKYFMGRKNRWNFSAEAVASKNAFTNPTYNSSLPYDFVVLGDENSMVGAGVHMGYQSVTQQFMEASIFYRYNSALSAEINYNLQAALTGNFFAVVFGVNGIQSMGGDDYSDAPSSKPEIGTANTELYNSVDRSYTDGFVKLNISPTVNWRVEIGGSYRASGISTDKGRTLFVNLIGQTLGESRKEKVLQEFKNYDIEGSIAKISPRGKFVKIDVGLGQGVEKGMKVDFYQIDYQGGNKLLASGVVFESRADSAIVKIQRRYSRIQLKSGQIARITN